MNDAAAGADAEAGPRPAVAAGIGITLLLLSAIVVFDAQRLPPGSAQTVGPAVAMRLVAGLVALLGIAHLVTAFRQRQLNTGTATPAPANHAALAWVLGALGGLMLILQVGGGFIAASTWLFVLAARGFGAPVSARSIAIGATLSTIVFVFFTRALSLGLPAGPLERLLS